MGYVCKYFDIKELVDEETYNKYGNKCWEFFDEKALKALDGVRDFFGVPVTVNTWYINGVFSYRGLRPRDINIGADFSQHRFGRSFDLDVRGLKASVVRRAILDNKDVKHLELISVLEDDVSWLHFDVRNTSDRIRLINP